MVVRSSLNSKCCPHHNQTKRIWTTKIPIPRHNEARLLRVGYLKAKPTTPPSPIPNRNLPPKNRSWTWSHPHSPQLFARQKSEINLLEKTVEDSMVWRPRVELWKSPIAIKVSCTWHGPRNMYGLGAQEFPPTTHQASFPIPSYVNKHMAESSKGVGNQATIVDEDVRAYIWPWRNTGRTLGNSRDRC